MLDTGLAPWPSFGDEEAGAALQVLRSGRVNQWTGHEVRDFEREFAAFTGSPYAVAVANGTVALDLALRALGIGPGDKVVVTPRTFIASVSCVVNSGAEPAFAEVDRDSGNISAATIRPLLDNRVKAIIPVHLAGWPCDMDAIMALANEFGIAVIEDCAQAHGARINGHSVGSFGRIGAWSFCQDKIMTTGGEGGMVTTADPELWRAMWSYKDHGKDWDAVFTREHPPGYRWVHESFGTNWRMLEVQAAIGRVQLRRMAQWHARRADIALAYANALAPFASAVRVPLPGAGLTHAWYRFYAYIRPDGLKSGWNRDRIVREMVAQGIPVFQGTCSEVYLEKAFDNSPARPLQRLPVARELGETSVMFLTHPTLTDEDVTKVCNGIVRIFAAAAA